MTTGQALWKYLANVGVEYIFGIIGRESESMEVPEAVPRFVLFHNEMCAGIAAEVYGRVSGRPQVCFSTMGPGVTNLLTGVASAFKDRSPLLAVSAQSETYEQHPDTHQYLDSVGLMGPVTKGAWEVTSAEELYPILDKAFQKMIEPRKGPCFVSLPADLFAEEYAHQERMSTAQKIEPYVDWSGLDDFVRILENSSQPLIVCGNAALYGETPGLVEKLASSMNIPVATSLAGKGVISERHPLSMGCFTKYIEEFFDYSLGNEIFAKVDTLILVGYDHGEDLTPKLWKSNPPKQILRINPVDDGLESLFPESCLIVDPELDRPIREILNRVSSKKELGIDVARLRSLRDARAGENFTTGTNCMSPFRAVRVVQNGLPEEALVTVDVGLHKHICGQIFESARPLSYIGSNGLATMGFGLPAAIGAKLAHPDRPVLTFCGDGGFHSVAAELETCKRENIPLIVVVLKDNAYGLIRRYHYKGFSRYEEVSTKFNDTDFALLAQAYGCRGFSATDEDSLSSALKTSLKSNQPSLIEVRVDYNLS